MKMTYISTRGGCDPLGFRDVTMTGLARDGGLFLPSAIPDIRSNLSEWSRLSYQQLAFNIMRLYVDIPDAHLMALIEKSYSVFRHPEVTPLVSPSPDMHMLELFHGPTLAFKDVALQLLGNMFEYFLERDKRSLNLLVATSGDTGSAAIHGVRGKEQIKIFVLYPNGRVSPAQERQMTTVPDKNVFCIAVDGSFDDCQAILKQIFCDLEFRDRYMLGAVNSINWARVLAQMVYYFYAAFRVMDRTGARRVRFAVPTGNFGDIFAGYLAVRMGLPAGALIVACNENDILSRFFNTGIYRKGEVRKTVSPSMDIQVASNFERYLYYLVGGDPVRTGELMKQFAVAGELELDIGADREKIAPFAAGSADTGSALAEMRGFYEKTGYLLDPHTAVGVRVARSFLERDEPVICLATAHPAKFGDVVRRALGKDIAKHDILDGLKGLPTRRALLPACAGAVQDFIAERS